MTISESIIRDLPRLVPADFAAWNKKPWWPTNAVPCLLCGYEPFDTTHYRLVYIVHKNEIGEFARSYPDHHHAYVRHYQIANWLASALQEERDGATIIQKDNGAWLERKSLILNALRAEYIPPTLLREAHSIEHQARPAQDSAKVLNQNQLDKRLTLAVAKTLWHLFPQMTLEEVKGHFCTQEFGNAKEYTRDETIREWLREVDPRTTEQKQEAIKRKPKNAA